MAPKPSVNVGDGVSFSALGGKRAAGKVESILASSNGSKLYVLRNDGSRAWVDLASFKEVSENPLDAATAANSSPLPKKGSWPPASQANSWAPERSPAPKPSLIEDVLTYAASHNSASAASSAPTKKSSRLSDRLAQKATTQNHYQSSSEGSGNGNATNYDLPSDFPDRDATALYHHLSNGSDSTPTRPNTAATAPKVVQATPSLAAALANPGHVKASAAKLLASSSSASGVDEERPRALFQDRPLSSGRTALQWVPRATTSSPPPETAVSASDSSNSQNGPSSLLAARRASQLRQREGGAGLGSGPSSSSSRNSSTIGSAKASSSSSSSSRNDSSRNDGKGSSASNQKSAQEIARGIVREASANAEIRDTTPSLLAARKNNTVKLRLQTMRTAASNSPPPFALAGTQQRFTNNQRPAEGSRKNALVPQPQASSSTSSSSLSSKASSKSSQSSASPQGSAHRASPDPISPLTAGTTGPSSSNSVGAAVEKASTAAASPAFHSPVGFHETSVSSSRADELPSPPARISNRAPSPSFLSLSPAALALLQEPLPPYMPPQSQPDEQPKADTKTAKGISANNAPALTYSALVSSYRAPASSSNAHQRDAQPPATAAPAKRGAGKPAQPPVSTSELPEKHAQQNHKQQQSPPQQQQQQQQEEEKQPPKQQQGARGVFGSSTGRSPRPQPSKPLYKPSANLRAKTGPWARNIPPEDEQPSDPSPSTMSSTSQPGMAMGGAAVTGSKPRKNFQRSPPKEMPPSEQPREKATNDARTGRLTPEPDREEADSSGTTAAIKRNQPADDHPHVAPETASSANNSNSYVGAPDQGKKQRKSSPEATATASEPSTAPSGIVKRLAGRFTPPAPSNSPANRTSPASNASPLLVHLKPSSPLIPSPSASSSSPPPNATTGSASKTNGGWLSGRKSPKPPWSKAATSVAITPSEASSSSATSSSSSLTQQQPPWWSGKRALRSLLTERPTSSSPDSSSNTPPPPQLVAGGGPAVVSAPRGTSMPARNVLRTPSPMLSEADATAPVNGVAETNSPNSSPPSIEEHACEGSEAMTPEDILVPAMREDGFGGYTLLARRAAVSKDVVDANRWTDVESAPSAAPATATTEIEPAEIPAAIEKSAVVDPAAAERAAGNVILDTAVDEEIAVVEEEDEDEAEVIASRSRRRRILSTTPPFDPPEAAGRLNDLEPLGLANGWPGMHHHAAKSERSWIAGAGSPVYAGELSPVNSNSFDGAVADALVEPETSPNALPKAEPTSMESPTKAEVEPGTVALTPVASSPLQDRLDASSTAEITPAPENPFKAPATEAAETEDLLGIGSSLAPENAPMSPTGDTDMQPSSGAVDDGIRAMNEVSTAMTATEAYNIAEAEAAARRAMATTPSATPTTIAHRVLEANAARQLARSLDATEFSAACADFPPITTSAATKAEFDDLLKLDEPKTEAMRTDNGENKGDSAVVEAEIDPFESLVSESQADATNISELALGDVSMLSAETSFSQTDNYTLNLSLDDVAVGEVVKGADGIGGEREEGDGIKDEEQSDEDEDEEEGEDVDSDSDSSVEVSGLPTLDEEDEEEDESTQEESVEHGDGTGLKPKLTPVAEETSVSSSPRKPLRRDLTWDEVLEEAGVDTSNASISPQTSANDVLAKAAARLSPDLGSAPLNSDAFFMAIAELSAKQSTDKIQAGACIVNSDGHIVGLGSRTVPDDMPLGSADDDAAMDDLSLVVHAEVAALLHSSSVHRGPAGSNHQRSSHRGHTLYLHGAVPCDSCARLIAQSGFKEVVMFGADVAKDSTPARLFARAGVTSRALPIDALSLVQPNSPSKLSKADDTAAAAAEADARVASAEHRADAAEHRAAAAERRASSLAQEVETLRGELEEARAEADSAASRDLEAREAAEALAVAKEEEAASALEAAATALEEAAEAAAAAEQEKETSALLKQQMNELRAALSPQNSINSSRFLSPGGAGELSFDISPLNNPDLFSSNNNNTSALDRSATIPPFLPAAESATPGPTEFDFFNPGHDS